MEIGLAIDFTHDALSQFLITRTIITIHQVIISLLIPDFVFIVLRSQYDFFFNICIFCILLVIDYHLP